MEFKTEEVEGFGNLNNEFKKLFENIAPKYIAAQGLLYRPYRQPVKVSHINNSETEIRVDLKNGDYQIFNINGTWY